MSYTSTYLNSSLPENAGLGSKIWLLKIPRTIASLPLLGSLVQNIDDGIFTKDYPAAYPMSDMGLFLNKIQQLGSTLNIPLLVPGDTSQGIPADPKQGYKVALSSTLAGISITIDESSGLDLSLSGSIPGLPLALNLGVDFSSTSSVTLSFGPGSRLDYIPTDYLSRLSKNFAGNPKTAFPDVAVSIPNNLIVDVIAVGKNYSLAFTQKSSLSTTFGATLSEANANAAGKFSITSTNSTSFKIAVSDNIDYLIGLQTISWDQLDSN